MDRVFLEWNLPNWITVVLMVALGYLVFGLVSQLLMRRAGSAGGGTASTSVVGNVTGGGFPGAALLYGGASDIGYAA